MTENRLNFIRKSVTLTPSLDKQVKTVRENILLKTGEVISYSKVLQMLVTEGLRVVYEKRGIRTETENPT